MLRQSFLWLAIISVLLNPVLVYATEVRVVGPVEKGEAVHIGTVQGTILMSDADGIYVKVSKEDLKFEYHGDPEILKIADMYHDKDWDRWHVLLFLPKSIVNSYVETVQEEEKEDKTSFECYMLGKQRARSLSTSGSSMGGLAGGLFLGLIGMGLAVALQSDPSVPYHIIPEGEDCQMPFIQGFQEEGKGRKRSAALTGGLVGTAFLVVLIVAANSSN